MIFKKPFLFFAALLVLTGCATQRFDFVNTPVNTAPTLDDDQTFWVGGIGQTAEIDAAKTCGAASKVVRIETMQTPGDVALTFVTLSIYAPRHIRVTCK
ncbi:MAG: lipoprotein bor [Betaproteobacteria bacterium]